MRGGTGPTGGAIYSDFTKRSKSYSDEYYPRRILKFDCEYKTVHPTQKPVALLEYMIRTYTKPGQTVLDNCMGSGSTGVACANTGRSFIGIELDREYFKASKKRIAEARRESNEIAPQTRATPYGAALSSTEAVSRSLQTDGPDEDRTRASSFGD
jgi:DNA modification methylase